jgi:hypothetical protein
VPWRLLPVVFGILAVLAPWYVLTVNAIRNDFDEVIRLGADGIPLTGLNDEEGISFAGYYWKNTSVLPITILGVEPIRCRPTGNSARCDWARWQAARIPCGRPNRSYPNTSLLARSLMS